MIGKGGANVSWFVSCHFDEHREEKSLFGMERFLSHICGFEMTNRFIFHYAPLSYEILASGMGKEDTSIKSQGVPVVRR